MQNVMLRKTAQTIMVAFTPENLREKMKMVPGWLREGAGGFARIAKNENYVNYRVGNRGSGTARNIPDHADGPFAVT